jgi:hypothetical protein
MHTIRSFEKIRRDGQVIHEQMTPLQIAALGTPERVTTVQWECDGRPVVLRSQHGVLAKVLPGREFVAILEMLDDSGVKTTLSVLNGDGSLRATVSNEQIVRGQTERGEFGWFEPARTSGPNHFGVVFRRDTSDYDLQLDIDGTTGTVIGVYETR